MSLTLTLCTDKQEWDSFLASSLQGNIFCYTPFLDALGEEYELLLVKKYGGIHVGALVLKHDGHPVKQPHTYHGILFSDLSGSMPYHKRLKWMLEAIDFLLAEMERRYECISFSLHYSVEDIRSFQWFHYHEPNLGQFKVGLKYTGLIGLKAYEGFENYIKSIRKTRGYEYRKAINDGFIAESSNDIDKLADLHCLTFQRQGIKQSGMEIQVLRNIAAAALSKGFGELLLCKDSNGNVASATLYLYDKRCGYYFFGANDPDFRNTGSGTFLMLENIKRCYEKGIYLIDVCGINSPNRGDFKVSFNAAPMPYFEVTWKKSG